MGNDLPFFRSLILAIAGSCPFNLFITNRLTLQPQLTPWQGHCFLLSFNCRSWCNGRNRPMSSGPPAYMFECLASVSVIYCYLRVSLNVVEIKK